MASPHKVLEQCQVSPPKDSVPTTSLPLTFLDLPWFVLSQPVQRLYFYELPHPTHHVTQTLLPTLKHSLSLTLQHFFPLSGRLTCPPPPAMPYILYSADQSNSITFNIVESTANFTHLIGNHPRHVKEFDHLVPNLPDLHYNNMYSNSDSNSNDTNTFVVPILALQATIFPNSGICIAIAYRHVVDGRTANHFMKCWASVFKSRGDLSYIHKSPPIYDRDLIKDPKGYQPILFNQYINLRSTWKNLDMGKSDSIVAENVRATYVLRRKDIENLKQFVITQFKIHNESPPKHYMSKFVVACAFVWVCLMKAQDCSETGVTSMEGDELLHIGFAADIRNLLPFPVATYFGNCLTACYVAERKRELISEHGIVMAAKALVGAIVELKSGDFEGLKRMVSFRKELVVPESGVGIAGSPNLHVYGTDFGWGRPKKVEVVHFVDSKTFSLAESRDGEDGIEIGLALGRATMDAFTCLFEQGLKVIC